MSISQDDLAKLVEEAKLKVEIGARYRHYKSSEMTYRAKDIVIQEADCEPCVIYQAEYGNKLTFSRPVNVWLETVKSGGIEVPRFTKI